jgi:hypothetical protein
MSRVPAPSDGGDQGLADQGGTVGAARQQAGVAHEVGDLAAGAPGPVRAHRQQPAAQLAHRASRTRPHGRRASPQSGQRSLRRASASLAAAVSKTSSIVHPARFCPGHRLTKGGAGVAAWHRQTLGAT